MATTKPKKSKTSVTTTHEEKETLAVDINLPGHDPRTTTPLFVHSKKELEVTEGGRCYICNCTADEAGPLEAHHHPIERSLAEMVDWELVYRDAIAGHLGPAAQAFNWDGFFQGCGKEIVPGRDITHPQAIRRIPKDPYLFVDDMRVNGRLLCKKHHIGKDEGIHAMPYPLWIIQRYAKEGYQFSSVEIIHHDQGG